MLVAQAIDKNQVVVIVCGETGSGKTHRFAQSCAWHWGAAWQGLIGHTQPRHRRAASPAALRRELNSPLGEAVGYKVRFNDKVSERKPHQADDRRHSAGRDANRPLLNAYDTIIIGEGA